MEYKRFLVSTDGSELSNRALAYALDMAKLCGASVVAMTVVAHYPRSYFEGEQLSDIGEAKRTEERWLAAAQEMLQGVQAKAQAAQVQLTTKVVHSDLIGESIVKTAQENDCNLIIMATAGRKGLSRVLMGSETQYVITHSPIPVLVVPKTHGKA